MVLEKKPPSALKCDWEFVQDSPICSETSWTPRAAAARRWPGLQISCIQKSGQRGWEKSAQKQEGNQHLVFSGLQERGE